MKTKQTRRMQAELKITMFNIAMNETKRREGSRTVDSFALKFKHHYTWKISLSNTHTYTSAHIHTTSVLYACLRNGPDILYATFSGILRICLKVDRHVPFLFGCKGGSWAFYSVLKEFRFWGFDFCLVNNTYLGGTLYATINQQ